MKTNTIKHHISSSSPHIWLVNETKSHTPIASHIHVPNYNIYESPAICSTATCSKWGVIAAVRRDLHSQRVPMPDGLAGHVVVLDVAIPTASAWGFILRILAIYAPWDPGGPQPTPQQFWSMLTPLCQDAPSHVWCVIGDCNLTLASSETTSTGAISPNHGPYLDFLCNTDGSDLWLASPDRSALTQYTFAHGSSRSILDRVAHSHSGIPLGSVDVAPVYIPATDHCAISATLALSLPDVGNSQFSQYPQTTPSPCFRYPSKNSRDTLTTFAAYVDDLISKHHLSGTQVSDDASFCSLYESLTNILLTAALATFQLPASPSPSLKLGSPTIRLLVCETRRVSCLIFAAKTGPITLQ